MGDATFKPVEINFAATIKESFAFTVKNIGHVLKVQWAYFVIIFLMAYLPQHVGNQPAANMDAADVLGSMQTNIGQSGMSFLGMQVLGIVRYTLDIIYINTLYEWLAYGGDLKPFYQWPFSKNVWSRMILDVKVACASFLPILVALMIVIPFGFAIANGNSGLSIGVIVLLGLISIPWSFYWGAVYLFASPIIYEPKRVSLMKDFWRATKGNRAKMLGWNLVVMLFFVLLAGIVMGTMPLASIEGDEALKNRIVQLADISAPIIVVLTMFTSIFGTYFVVSIWKKLRVNVPQLA